MRLKSYLGLFYETEMETIVNFDVNEFVQALQKFVKLIGSGLEISETLELRSLERRRDFEGRPSGSMITEQIFVIIDNDLWWRLYWNPVSQDWLAARHTIDGWDNSQKFSTKDLLSMIPDYKDVLRTARGFEHKTITGLVVYKAVEHSLKSTKVL